MQSRGVYVPGRLLCAPGSIRMLVAIAMTTFVATAAGQSLTQLEVIGPDEVLGGETAAYTVRAEYDNGMDFEVILCGDIYVDSEDYAQIDRFGQLTAVEVDSDQIVTVQASYTDGITLYAELQVTIIAASPLECEFPTYLWSRSVGGLGEDSGYGFATDGSGNVWVVGSFEGVVDFDPSDDVDIHESAGAEDVFVTRLDALGSHAWTRTFGGIGSDLGWSIGLDSEGNVVVTGCFEQTVDFDPGIGIDPRSSNGGRDVFAVKLDASGSYVWARTIGGALDDDGADIAVDDEDDVVLSGCFQHQVDFDPTDGEDLRGSHGSYDIFLLKLGEDGSYQWAYTVGGLQADEGLAVAVDPDGNVWGTGRFRTVVDFDPGPGDDVRRAVGGTDVFVTRLGADGSYQGAQTFGGPSTDGAYDISAGSTGEVAIAGYFWETVDFDPSEGVDEHTSAGQSDLFVTRLRSDGSYRWTQTVGGLGSDEGSSLSVDPTGNVLTTGHFRGVVDFDPGEGTDERASNGGSDAFVLKLRSNGSYEWAATAGGAGNDAGEGLVADGQGLIMLTGSFSGLVDFDPTEDGIDEHSSSGAADAFTLVVQCAEPADDDDDCASPTFLWAQSAGGPGDDSGYRFATDGHGNVWVVGSFEGEVDFDPTDDVDLHTSSGEEDAFVTRLYPDGSYGWTRTFGGPGSDIGVGVGVDADANVFVVGSFELMADFDPGPGFDMRKSNGGTDVFVVKLDAGGSEAWAHAIGGSENDEGADAAVDSWGDVVVTGHFQYEVDFDPTQGDDLRSSHGDRDIFILKLGGDATYGWAYTVGGLQADEGLAVAVDTDGKVYGTGRFRRIVDFDPGLADDSHQANGGTDVFVTRLGRDGSYEGAQTFGGSSTDGAYDISVGGDGELSVTGYFWDAVDFDPTEGVDEHTSAGQSDIFVTHLGPEGTYRWTQTVGGPLLEEGLATSVDASGNTLVTGHFRGSVDFDPTLEVDEHTAVGGEDVFLLRLRPDGSYAWTVTLGGDGTDLGQGIATDPHGRIMLTGSFSGLADLDPSDGEEEHASNGAADVFIVMLRCTSRWPCDTGSTDPIEPVDIRAIRRR
jgi:hypothetical protein